MNPSQETFSEAQNPVEATPYEMATDRVPSKEDFLEKEKVIEVRGDQLPVEIIDPDTIRIRAGVLIETREENKKSQFIKHEGIISEQGAQAMDTLMHTTAFESSQIEKIISMLEELKQQFALVKDNQAVHPDMLIEGKRGTLTFVVTEQEARTIQEKMKQNSGEQQVIERPGQGFLIKISGNSSEEEYWHFIVQDHMELSGTKGTSV